MNLKLIIMRKKFLFLRIWALIVLAIFAGSYYLATLVVHLNHELLQMLAFIAVAAVPPLIVLSLMYHAADKIIRQKSSCTNVLDRLIAPCNAMQFTMAMGWVIFILVEIMWVISWLVSLL